MKYDEIITELTGYKKITQDVISKEKSIRQLFTDAGYVHVGSGSYGYAYRHPSGYIVKVVLDGDHCYYKFVEYCLKNQNNPHLPKFKTKLLRKFNENFYVVRMEELIRLTEKEYKAAKILIDHSNHPLVSLPAKPYHVLKNKDEEEYEFPKQFDHVPEYKTFFDTLLDVNKNRPSKCYEDLTYSQSNVMKRSNGIFVILDPWYSPRE